MRKFRAVVVMIVNVWKTYILAALDQAIYGLPTQLATTVNVQLIAHIHQAGQHLFLMQDMVRHSADQ